MVRTCTLRVVVKKNGTVIVHGLSDSLKVENLDRLYST